jgi:hypothetical protein
MFEIICEYYFILDKVSFKIVYENFFQLNLLNKHMTTFVFSACENYVL